LDDFGSIIGGLTTMGSSLLGGLMNNVPKVLGFLSNSGTMDKLSTISDNVGIMKGMSDMVRGVPNTPAS
jgi:hypothetical protein